MRRQPGEAELVAAFSGVRSAPVVVFVLDELDYVAEVSIAADYCSGADSPSLAPCTSTFCPSTFRGSRGAQRQLRISAVMSSGFRYPDLER